MFYAIAAMAAVQAKKEYRDRCEITTGVHQAYVHGRINDPREVTWAREQEEGAYLDMTYSWFKLTDTPDAIDRENEEDYHGPRFFAPVTHFVDDADIDY